MRADKSMPLPREAAGGNHDVVHQAIPLARAPILGDTNLRTSDRGALVESVVIRINAICKNATFDFAMTVGKLIVESIYGGDLTAWRNRRTKDASFRKLAKHPNLPMSASALYRSVAIYELTQRLGIDRRQFVSTSHLRLLLPLPSERQRELLRQTEAEAWSVRRLREEIELGDVPPREATARGGWSKGSRLRRTIQTLQKYVDSSNHLMGVEGDIELSPDSARSVTDLARRLREACTALEGKVSRYMPQT